MLAKLIIEDAKIPNCSAVFEAVVVKILFTLGNFVSGWIVEPLADFSHLHVGPIVVSKRIKCCNPAGNVQFIPVIASIQSPFAHCVIICVESFVQGFLQID